MVTRRSLMSVLVVLAGAGLGLWWMQSPPPSAVHRTSDGGQGPRVGESSGLGPSPASSVVAPSPEVPSERALGEGRAEASPGHTRTDPQLQAFLNHAQQAAPRLRRAARILRHADPPVYGEIAAGLADRLDAVTESTSLGERQELAVEQRQLVEHLQRRYRGLEGLEPLLQDLAAGLEELEAGITEVGPSPDPRSGSTEPADALNGQ